MFMQLTYLFAAANSHCFSHHFFGLVPWYEYLKDRIDSQCNIRDFNILPGAHGSATDIPLVLAAVVDDLLRIAGVVALAFVLVGAIRYVYSQGDPESTAKAQETLVNALIGLVVALIGVAFVNFLGKRLA